MLVDKSDLLQVLQTHTKRFALKNELSKELSSFLKDKHGVSIGETLDAIRGTKELEEYSEMFLFFLSEGMFNLLKDKELNPNLYFSKIEIKEYSTVYISNDNKIDFPLVIQPVIQTANNQWITVVDTNFLLKLKNNQMINYNANTQRNMIKSIKGEKVVYKINLNMNSVNSIKKSMEDKNFVSNTLTFNIPEEESDFSYDSETLTLVIGSLDHFDIVDGYHRYMALCKAREKDEDFNYPMELRIINFTETKCKNFIFQEDQRNHMKKIDSKVYDTNDVANVVTQRLNEDPTCVFNNQIIGNGGMINAAEFSECIRYYLCKDANPAQRNIFIIEITKYLKSCLESLVEYDIKYIDGSFKYDFKKLNIIMYIFAQYRDIGVNEKTFKEIELLLKKVNQLDKNVFSRTTITKTNANRIEALRKKVCKNV